MISIAIVGPESTGKTTLAQSLAKQFETVWVPEYSREYLNALDRPYNQTDLIEIASGQLRAEKKVRKKAKDLIFLDTDLFVIKVWSEFKYGNCDPWILQQLEMNKADFYLLTFFDVPYEDDPLRESPENRPELFDIYEKELKSHGVNFQVVQGSSQKRLEQAIENINRIR